jgi:peptidoglycan/LPS O-acetylase OafA/YrhL
MHSTPSSENITNSANKSPRLYYIDWLRILAMLVIFFMHSSSFWAFGTWHVKSYVTSLGIDIFVESTHWVMPIFFILAGASVYFSLKSRSAGGFIKERTLRILIPIIFLGFFIIAPPQVYLERLTQGDFSGSFFEFYHHYYFDGFYGLGGNFAIVPMHMWFLWLLFIFSLILLPIFLPKKENGKSLGFKLAILFEKPWTFVVPVLLLAGSQVLLNDLGDIISWGGGWNHLSYLIFFISGYLIFSNAKIRENISRYTFTALIIAIAMYALIYMLRFDIINLDIPDELGYFIVWIILALRTWFFIMAILGFGSKFLNFNNRFVGYANEAVLPFYILHQTVILIIGFFVLQLSIGIAPSYAIITICSFIVIMVIYEFLVRRINVFRFLFGMRLKKKPRIEQT